VPHFVLDGFSAAEMAVCANRITTDAWPPVPGRARAELPSSQCLPEMSGHFGSDGDSLWLPRPRRRRRRRRAPPAASARGRPPRSCLSWLATCHGHALALGRYDDDDDDDGQRMDPATPCGLWYTAARVLAELAKTATEIARCSQYCTVRKAWKCLSLATTLAK
jgi:hypothetical protein